MSKETFAVPFQIVPVGKRLVFADPLQGRGKRMFAYAYVPCGGLHCRVKELKKVKDAVLPEGIAHLLEHTVMERMAILRSHCHVSGFTTFRSTEYLAILLKKEELVRRFLETFFLVPPYTEESLDHVRADVLDECSKMVSRTTLLRVFLASEVLYGKGPWGRDVTGTSRSVATIRARHVNMLRNAAYGAEDVTLVFFGAGKLARRIKDQHKQIRAQQRHSKRYTVDYQEPASKRHVPKQAQPGVAPDSDVFSQLTIAWRTSEVSDERMLLRKEVLTRLAAECFFGAQSRIVRKLRSLKLLNLLPPPHGTVWWDVARAPIGKSMYVVVNIPTSDPSGVASLIREIFAKENTLPFTQKYFEHVKMKIWRSLCTVGCVLTTAAHWHSVGVDVMQLWCDCASVTPEDLQHFLKSDVSEWLYLS